MPRPSTAVVSLAAVPAAIALGSADAATVDGTATVARAVVDTTTTDPTFTRYNVDTAITGAAFTTVGTVFAGEQDIVTSGYGPVRRQPADRSGGTLQLYRPGATLDDWTKVTVFGPEAGIILPNATTVADVDGDGDNDIIVPSGHFFGTDPGVAAELHTTRQHHLVGERRRRTRRSSATT